MQNTRVYDYMIRSGTIECRWGDIHKTFPIGIGADAKKDESYFSVQCVLSASGYGLRVELHAVNQLGFPVHIMAIRLDTTVLLPEKTPVFCNGYQSWSDSKLCDIDHGWQRPTFLCPEILKNAGDYNFLKQSGRSLHSWTYTYFRQNTGFTLMASLDESVAYTLFRYVKDPVHQGLHLVIEKDCEGLVIPAVPRVGHIQHAPQKILDVYIETGDETSCWDHYFDSFYRLNESMGLRNRSKPALVWDSWYLMYDQPNSPQIRDLLQDYRIRQIPLDYCVISRGYEREFGDWSSVSEEKFPEGLKQIAMEIKEAGFRPGIALSPFVCSEKSQVFRERRELMAQNRKGKLIPVGYSANLGGRLYLIDLYNPEGRKYVRRMIHALTWDAGFQYIKADFLYAAGLNSGYFCGRTRAQALKYALSLLRECIGNIPLHCCGVPLGSCFGRVEYVSVAPDLSVNWTGESRGICTGRIRERESAENAVSTSIGRRHLDGRAFSADTVTVSLRKYKTKYTPHQQDSLLKTGIIFGGLISCSDNIGAYNTNLLAKYRQILLHKCTYPHDKRILSVNQEEKGIRARYLLKGSEKEETIPEVRL
jgi:alpha-galactosidase